jgi:hypothetical protein
VLQSMLNSSASTLLDSGSSGRPFASSGYSAQSGTTPFVHHGGKPRDSLSQCGFPGGRLQDASWVVPACRSKTLKLMGAASRGCNILSVLGTVGGGCSPCVVLGKSVGSSS